MKGVESFLYLLAIAIVIIVVMLAFSSIDLSGGSGGEQASFEEFSAIGIVGFSSESVARTIRIGELRVGETQDTLLKEVVQVDITQGLTGGEREEFTVPVTASRLEQAKGAKITFSVLESTPLGNLHVRWNGKEFFNSQASGFEQIEIPKDFVKRENRVEIWADGPGAQFWAATHYEGRSFKVFLLEGPQKIIPFELFPGELQTFNRGEIAFFQRGSVHRAGLIHATEGG